MTAERNGPLAPDEVEPLLAPYVGPGSPGAVLAVSGGPDSVALMRLAAPLRRAPLVVATVDHGLRPESHAEAETVAGWAAAVGLPHRILTWDGDKPGSGVQEAARAARYRLLTRLAREVGAPFVLTAHHRDDQAETVLMRLARGSGPAGLSGMRRETDRDGAVLARPFLDLAKARLVATCRAHGWPFLDDPSNADPRFARTRMRALLPALAAEGLTAERLAILAERMRRADAALDARAASVLAAVAAEEGGDLVIDAGELGGEPAEIVLRVLAAAIWRIAPRGEADPVRLERLEELTKSFLAAEDRFAATLGGAWLTLDGSRLRIRPEPPRRASR
ncbi:MAG TPA: tRNA lysidine(34) synthetase TilS [Beijerinckiaceae bacterium]|nr:tRNA lysidine(34) synthetase TilS [Beijerinckiaceae bacterium]